MDEVQLFEGQWKLPVSVRKCEKIISDEYQFVCIAVPKVARTSLIDALTRNPPDSLTDSRLTVRPPLGKILRKEKYPSYFKFAFVRNPWARTVSAYKSKVGRPSSPSTDRFIASCTGLELGMPFEAFVDWLGSDLGSDGVVDRHFCSQWLFVSDPGGTIAVDFVGRYERLQQDFDLAIRRIGLETFELPVLNSRAQHGIEYKAGENDSYWQNFYTPELVEKVGRRYAADVATFGYRTPELGGL